MKSGRESSYRPLTLGQLRAELASLAEPVRAAHHATFFKTGKGQYGEGDRFLGIPVPAQRKVARRYAHMSLDDVARLLRSPIHEHRFTGVEILVLQYERAPAEKKEEICSFYVSHGTRLNNWDLVDTSAPYILGEHLSDRKRSRAMLYELAQSPDLWERRIAIIATLALIKKGETRDTFRLAEILLDDTHDLIHKAVGWSLRESGRVSRAALLRFLKKHYYRLPRTTLRYAIEHLPPPERKLILAGVFPKLESEPDT
jgi:3-methyladenine DNA glycosylase AlkD